MKNLFLALTAIAALLNSSSVFSQSAAINNTGAQPHPSAALDVSSVNKGLLIPRMDSTQRSMIATPATGLLVFQTNGTKPGFYYFNGLAWDRLNDGTSSNLAGPPKAKITYRVAPNASGGSAIANTWTTRPLNTVAYDDIGVVLSNSLITLPAGTYEVSAYCVFNNANYNVGCEKIRIQDVTNATTLGISLNSSMSVAANFANYPAMINAERFSLASPSNIALQYHIDFPDFGPATSSSGQQEIFAEVIISRLQ